MLTVADLS